MLLPVVVLSVSFARLPDTAGAVEEPGMVPVQMLEDQRSVPTEWGKLVAVDLSNTGSRLWFQDEEGTIRRVHYNNRTRRLEQTVRVIQRR